MNAVDSKGKPSPAGCPSELFKRVHLEELMGSSSANTGSWSLTSGPRGEEEGLGIERPAPIVGAGDHHLVLAVGLQRVEHVAAGMQRRR